MKVALTIPCRNEERYIEKCLLSVVNSDYPKELVRVMVCDGKSTDRTQEIIRRISQQYPNVELLVNEKQTTPFALNRGIKHASDCEVHIILGAHAEIAGDYISRCVQHIQTNPELGCVGGTIENINEDSTSELIAKAMSSPFGVGNAYFRTGRKAGFVDTVAFGAYPRRVFEKVGYFDEDLVRNQDDEFNYRVTEAGFKILLDPEIKSRYYVRASFSKLALQYHQYGFWKVYVNKKHGTVTTMRQLVPPLFVLFLVSAVAIPFIPYYWMAWCVFMGLYVVAATVAALQQKAAISEIPGILCAFFLLHFEYGLGYLRGIARFVIMGRKPASHHSTSSR